MVDLKDIEIHLNLQRMINLLPFYSYIKNQQGRFILCNIPLAQHLNLSSSEQISSKTDVDMPWGSNAKQIEKEDFSAFVQGGNLKTIIGDQILYRTIIFDDAQKPIALLGIYFDDPAYAKVYELEEIIALMPGHVFWKNKRCVLQGCNNNQAIDSGLQSRKDIVGKTAYDLLYQNQPEEDKRAQAAITDKIDLEIMNHNKAQSVEEFVVAPNGSKIYYWSTKTPLHDKEGNVSGLLGISLDITDRKKMEVDLEKAKERAEAASQAKSDFISNMEHDLRTPFSGIRGIAALLYDMEQDEEKKSLLEMMLKSCKQWENVHNRIFDALAVEQFIPLKIEMVSISKILRELEEEMCATVHVKGLTYVTEPIPDGLDKIKTDEAKLKLVLSCLISNAIKFTEKGGVSISVTCDKGHLLIQVKDTGIGIPADKLECIFEEFTKLSRSNTHASDFQGIGSGLYIGRKCATQLGASITVESQLNKGSVFTVTIPM